MKHNQYPNLAIVIVLLATTAITVMAGALVGPILPLINLEFQDMSRVSMLLTLPALGVVFMAPFVGKLVHHAGKKTVLLLALLLYAIAGTSGLWLNSLTHLLVGRFALGMSMAMIMTLTSTLIADLSSGKGRDRLLSQQAMAMHIGAVAFVSLTGYLAEMGWRLPFGIYFLSLGILALAIFALPNTKSQHTEGSAKINKATWRSVAPFYGMAFVGMSMFYLIPVFYAFLASDLLNASASQIGNTLAIFSVVAAIASLNMPKLAQALFNSRILALAFFTYAAGHLILAYATNWPMLIVGGSLTGAGFGLMFPAISRAIAARSTLNNRAVLMSGFVSAYYLGQFATPMIGKAIMTTDIQSIFLVSSAAMLSLSLGLLIYKSNRPVPADA